MKKLIFVFLLILQSCSSDGYRRYMDHRLSIKADSYESDYSIAIVKIDTKSVNYQEKVFDRNFNKMNWCIRYGKKCKGEVYFNPYTKIKFRDNFGYNYYLIKPNHYYLDRIDQNKSFLEEWYFFPITIPVAILTFGNSFQNSPNFNTSSSGYNKKLDQANYASFEVEPKEIVYIGDLYFTFTKQKYWFKGKGELEVIDNYDEAVKAFREKYPRYKDKPVVKRLTKVGALFANDKYDDGVFW